jgi:hypothetical protein
MRDQFEGYLSDTGAKGTTMRLAKASVTLNVKGVFGKEHIPWHQFSNAKWGQHFS